MFGAPWIERRLDAGLFVASFLGAGFITVTGCVMQASAVPVQCLAESLESHGMFLCSDMLSRGSDFDLVSLDIIHAQNRVTRLRFALRRNLVRRSFP